MVPFRHSKVLVCLKGILNLKKYNTYGKTLVGMYIAAFVYCKMN